MTTSSSMFETVVDSPLLGLTRLLRLVLIQITVYSFLPEPEVGDLTTLVSLFIMVIESSPLVVVDTSWIEFEDLEQLL